MVSLIDTHSHIYEPEFDNDRDDVVARAVEAGVTHILLPAIDADSYERQAALAASRPALFSEMMGLHPTSVNEDFESALAHTRKLLFDGADHYVGVGEIGMDLYWDRQYQEQQVAVLDQQLTWAEQLGKPVVLHIRNAYQEVFELLEHRGSATYLGIMHCFSGTLDDALRAIEMGFVLGIGGVLTYKKSLLPDIVRAVPLDKLVLETDAPYLAPVPHRGQRNESAYVAIVAQNLAAIKQLPLEEVAAVTSATACRVFSL